MKKLLILCVILYACASTQADAESPPADENNTVYVKMDYMSLINSTPRKYFELELGIWKRIHEERIRQGVTTAWYLYSVVPGNNTVPDLPYDFITVSVYDEYDMVFDEMATEAIRIAYPGIDLEELYVKNDEARAYVRSDLWKMVDVVSPYTDSKPVSEYISVNFFDSRNHSGEHMELETGFWAGNHEERVRRGNLNSEAVFLLVNPEGTERNYNYATIDYYDNLTQVRQPVDVALAKTAHPDLAEEEIQDFFDRTPGARSVFKSELWRLVDYIDSVEEE